MRELNRIIIHCAATPEGMDVKIRTIDEWHRARGFKKIGYHYYIELDGTIQRGRDLWEVGAGVKGFNKDSIHICYAGGLGLDRKAKDTRTWEQKQSLEFMINELVETHPTIKEIKGHRDYSPDINNDGEITPDEWMKECPCFDAKEEYKHLLK